MLSLRRIEACTLRMKRAARAASGGGGPCVDGCIWDGACLRTSPQGAEALRRYRDDVERVRTLLRDGRKVVASLAPSYVAAFGDVAPGNVVAALRILGFARIEETARVLRDIVVQRAARLAESSGVAISTSCPSVVALIRRYYPEAARFLMPFPSPMIAHCARLRRECGPDAAIVFIGPCLAKKREASLMRSTASSGAVPAPVDVGLTFVELKAWLDEAGIDLRALAAARPDAEAPQDARLGLLQVGISGLDECVGFLDRLVSGRGERALGAARSPATFVELLACPGGCLNGPGMCDGADGVRPAAQADLSAMLAVRRQRAAMWALGELQPR